MRDKAFDNKMIDAKILFENQYPTPPIRLDDLSIRRNVRPPRVPYRLLSNHLLPDFRIV